MDLERKHTSYLDSLQGCGSFCNTLWHIKAFGRADFGIDQPLLEVSQGGTETLLQQTLLILTLPGCPEAETGGEQGDVKDDKWRQKHRGHMCRCADIVILSPHYRGGEGGTWELRRNEKQTGGEMVKWMKWKE